MTDTEQKALALVRQYPGCETYKLMGVGDLLIPFPILVKAIEAHEETKAEFEAFRREVSDVMEKHKADLKFHFDIGEVSTVQRISRFILPKPVDPLQEIVAEAVQNTCSGDKLHEAIRQALSARGGRVVFGEE